MKSFWKSKTVWLATAQCATAIIVILTTQYPELQTMSGVLILKSIVDIFLRTITTQKID